MNPMNLDLHIEVLGCCLTANCTVFDSSFVKQLRSNHTLLDPKRWIFGSQLSRTLGVFIEAATASPTLSCVR